MREYIGRAGEDSSSIVNEGWLWAKLKRDELGLVHPMIT